MIDKKRMRMNQEFDKQVTLDDIFATLDKSTLEMVRRGKDISKERIPTASFGINQVLGGGLGIGKQHTFWGGESSGKSALMLQTIGLNQRLGNPCALIDAEHSFDWEWAERLGVDTDNLAVVQASTFAEVTDVQRKLIMGGMRLVVIDSVSALMPRSYFDDGEMKNFEKTGQLGQFSRELGQMSKMIQGINFSCAVVHISQVRMDIGGNQMHVAQKPTQGKEAEHTDSFRIKLVSSKSDKKAIMGSVQHGNVLLEEKIGRKVEWNVNKNKINGNYGDGEYDLYTKGPTVGLDRASELLAYGIRYGVVHQGGAWYTVYDERFQGESKVKVHLRDNPEIMDKLEADIIAKSI